MKKRNKHFEKKFKKVEESSNFFVYAYTSAAKSDIDLILNRELYLIKLKKLNIPSAFKLEKIHKAQGPKIIIIYGQNLNFAKLNYLAKFKVLGLKINNFIYAYPLLKDGLLHKNAFNLCYLLNTNLLNILLNLPLVFSINEKLDKLNNKTS